MGSLPDSYKDKMKVYGLGTNTSSSSGPPDECESQQCTEEPELWIKYQEPEEKVYYCSPHGNQHMGDSKAVDMGYL